MRCAACHTYIPEGLTPPLNCPNCGRHMTAAEFTAAQEQQQSQPLLEIEDPAELLAQKTRATLATSETTNTTALPASPFAPLFTVKARLAFGLADLDLKPTEGSLSFGKEGFSIVSHQGKQWEKFFYREMGPCRVVGGAIIFEHNGVDSKLVLFHPWLPAFLPWPRVKRAEAFVKMVERFRK